MKVRFLIFVCIWWSTLPGTSQAQETEALDYIEQGKTALQAKQYRDAAFQLNKALNIINNLFVQQLKTCLPEPFGGWEADKPEGGGNGLALLSEISVKRRYYKRGTGKSIDVELISNAPKIPALRSWLSNPRLLNAQEGMQLVEINRQTCITKFDAVDRYAEVNLIIGASLLLVIRGFEAKNLDDVKKFTEKIDVAQIENKFP
ncbi:flagellar protein FliS [candidate division KSB1 bacterium]|nr:flagellar protein FliS [candidate division KSB1 bacterium]